MVLVLVVVMVLVVVVEREEWAFGSSLQALRSMLANVAEMEESG
jgi:hypothetical protein